MINVDKFGTDFYSKQNDCYQFLEFNSANLKHLKKNQLFVVKGYVLKDYVCCHRHLKITLKVYVLGLENVFTLTNYLTINLEGY